MNLRQPQCEPSYVHVWKFCLQDREPAISMDWFSDKEKELIIGQESFDNRIKFIRIYGFLKNVLMLYTHQTADLIELIREPNGKPHLKCNHDCPPFYFNLSHRNDYALLAISNKSIGVDVEEIKPIENFYRLLFSYFSKVERQSIMKEETIGKKMIKFYRVWTMKEALVKSLGVGLTEKFKKYDVSDFLECPIVFPKFDISSSWIINQIQVANNYQAAIAVKGDKLNCKTYSYSLLD